MSAHCKSLQPQQLQPHSLHGATALPAHTPSPLRDLQPDVGIQQGQQQSCSPGPQGHCSGRLPTVPAGLVCALPPRLPVPWARWMQIRSHRAVFAESIKEELISPEEALSSAMPKLWLQPPGSHPASQERLGGGGNSSHQTTPAGVEDDLCWEVQGFLLEGLRARASCAAAAGCR